MKMSILWRCQIIIRKSKCLISELQNEVKLLQYEIETYDSDIRVKYLWMMLRKKADIEISRLNDTTRQLL
jgi:hypothetical protein